jgi:signal transduction histidine kinase
LNAQDREDSIQKLQEELISEMSDSARISLHDESAKLYEGKNHDSVISNFDRAIAMANEKGKDSLEGTGYFNKGLYFDHRNNPKEAIRNYQIAIHIFENSKQTASLARAYNIVGYSYLKVYAEDKAIEYYLKSLSLYSSLNDEDGRAVNFIDIGNLYYDQENYEFARIYFEDALEIFKSLNDSLGIATSYINMGNAAADGGDVEKGLLFYKKSLKISEEKQDDYGLAVTYNNMGDCYITLKDYGKAKAYFEKSLRIVEDNDEHGLLSIVYLNLADASLKSGNYAQAISYAKKSNESAVNAGDLEIMAENYLFLSRASEKLGNNNQALVFLQQQQKLKDSLITIDKEKKVQLFNALNELEKSAFRINELSSQKEIAQLKYENEKKWTLLLIFGMVGFGLLIILLINQQTSKKKAYNLLAHKNKQIENMNDEIQLQRDDLNQLNKTKDKFFSIIAHDLKNPFNSIKGFTELMIENSQEYDKEKQLKFLKIIKESTNRASGLLNNLLIWANSQTGSLDFNPIKVGLKATVENVQSLLEIQAINKEIEVVNQISNEIYLKADENMLKTILRNLLSNAIKFTHSGGKVTIKATTEKYFVVVSVLDTGVGISNENRKNLFSVENKFSNSGTANEQGSGLGLILCKDFIEKHEGAITVSSIVDSGSEFKFSIPLWKD